MTHESDEVLKSNLLTTKLRIPTLPAKRVWRSRLIRKLDAGLASRRRITLVSAPAGFGKTTCVVGWVGTLDRRPVSWLSLDPADDDPGRFFAYFLAALQRVAPNLGREIVEVLRSGQLPSAEIIAVTLVNELSELENHFLLVLDDFHVIQDRFILHFFELLLANLPPSVHLILLTREDPPLPLAQLRATNQLTEIRAGDLRFTAPDVELFFNEVMDLSLSHGDLDLLGEKTEGWVAGLQLAGLSIRDREDPSAFIAGLSGSSRHILSYLTEQVLSRQAEEIKDFLLQTSILDKLNGDLCYAVTGRSDSHALLEKLFHANLFLIPLDDENRWYRYHHLFADLLRNLHNAYPESQRAELHRRAGRWYTQAGMASEAIEHALAAGDYPLAVDLLENHAMEMITQGYVKTVNVWAQQLPGEWERQSPRTNLAFAWAHLLRGAYPKASEYLDRLKATLTEDSRWLKDRSIQAEWLIIQSLRAFMLGEADHSLEMATRGLELAPERDSRVRSMAYYVQASVYQLRDEISLAIERYQMSIQFGRAAENLVAEMMSTVGLAGMVLERGQLHMAYEIASQAAIRIESLGSPPISAMLFAAIGDAHYQWDHSEEARRYLLRALELSTLGGSNTATLFCHVLLSRQAKCEGDLDSAAVEIQKAANLIPPEAPGYIRQEVAAQQVQIELARDHVAAAQMALQGQGFSFIGQFSYPKLAPEQSNPYATGVLYNSRLRILLHPSGAGNDKTDLQAGLALADHLIAGATRGEQRLVALEALLMRAQIHARLGNSRASQADYFQALGMGEPEGFICIFVEGGEPVQVALADLSQRCQLGTIQPEYVGRILAAFARSRPPSVRPNERQPQQPIAPLTGRELEVLHQMAEGLKYREIASRLFVSQNTVRFHVKAIYAKFNVNNRTQALEMARRHHLL